MNYSKGLLLFQDDPASSAFLRFIPLIIPVILLAVSLYLWTNGEGSGSMFLFIEGLFVGLLLWIVLPHKYQVFEDRLRIALGGPFAINIGFNQITSIEVTARTSFTINLVSSITRNYVKIARRKGPGIAITPEHNDLFVENANRALSQWKKSNPG